METYSPPLKMTEEQKILMEKYGIKCDQKILYLYKEYRYERLEDTFRYAEIETERERTSMPQGLGRD